MQNLKQLITQHRGACFLVLFLFVLFVGFSVMSAVSVAEKRNAEAEAEQSDVSDASEAAVEEASPLSDAQQKIIDGYDDETKALIDTLSASVWSANDGRYTLRFFDTYYVETENGTETAHPYAISACEFGNNGSDTEIDQIVFETDTGTHIATYTLVLKAKDETSRLSTIGSTTMFSLADTPYERMDAVKQISITGLNSEITDLLGNSDTLVSELSNWCANHYPVATEAVWSQNVTIDYAENIVVTSFSLSGKESGSLTGSNATVISVTYDRSAGTYAFAI